MCLLKLNLADACLWFLWFLDYLFLMLTVRKQHVLETNVKHLWRFFLWIRRLWLFWILFSLILAEYRCFMDIRWIILGVNHCLFKLFFWDFLIIKVSQDFNLRDWLVNWSYLYLMAVYFFGTYLLDLRFYLRVLRIRIEHKDWTWYLLVVFVGVLLLIKFVFDSNAILSLLKKEWLL